MDGESQRSRGSKRSNGTSSEVTEEKKKRSIPPGYTPFKQIEIPESWKEDPQAMQEAVWGAVAGCQYEDQQKKERLCTAVMEALSGQKTMKAAASTHDVPFTTLQTYFHRARARMSKAMSERENATPAQIPVPVSLSLSVSEDTDAMATTPKVGRLDSVLGLLTAKVGNQLNGEGKSPSPESIAPTGSNKRKPKNVHRVVYEPTTSADANPDEDGATDDLIENGDSGNPLMMFFQQMLETVPANATSATTDGGGDQGGSQDAPPRDQEGEPGSDAEKERFKSSLEYVVSVSQVDFDTKQRLKWAITDVFQKNLSVEQACNQYQLAVRYFNIYYEMVSKVMSRGGPGSPIRIDADETGPEKVDSPKNDMKKNAEKESYVVGPPLDPDDTDRLRNIEECVAEICKASLYASGQKERLRRAVSMVIRGEYTINAAANMMQLPSSTVHPYVHRARAALGVLLPPQASGPTLWNATKKIHDLNDKPSTADTGDEEALMNSSLDLDEIDKVITALVKNSLYDEQGRQKIYEATLMVLTENVSTTEAAKQYGMPASTIQPYVQRARSALGQPNLAVRIKKTGGTPKERNFKQQNSEKASEDEVRNVVKKVLSNCSAHNARREKLLAAVTLAVSGKMTIKDACQQEGLPASTVHPYVSKARHMLGARCPTPKMITCTQLAGASSEDPCPSDSQKNCKAQGSDGEADKTRRVGSSSGSSGESKADTAVSQGSDGLAQKIDKILQQHKYKGDRENMCDAIIKVFLEGKTIMEASVSKGLAATTLSTYVRIVKNSIKRDAKSEKGLRGNTAGSNASEDSLPKTQTATVCGARFAQNKTAEVSNKREDLGFEAEQPEAVLTKVQSCKAEADTTAKGRNFEFDEELESNKMIRNVDVMALHSDVILSSQERRTKLIISYLIEHQYKRSDEAQEKMRICLEDVLLDGLSVPETLKIHKGPTDHVLQVYLGRCRDAQKCITTEFPVFNAEVIRTVKKISLPPLVPEKLTLSSRGSRKSNGSNSSTNSNSVTPVRSSRRLQNRHRAADEETQEAVAAPKDLKGSVQFLKTIFTEAVLKPLNTYVKKLDSVNFPIEAQLVIGLAKTIYKELPESHRLVVTEAHWEEWAADYKKQHPEFDD